MLEQSAPLIGVAVLVAAHFGHSVWRFGKMEGEQVALRRDVEHIRARLNKDFVTEQTFREARVASAEMSDRHEREVFSRFDRIEKSIAGVRQ